MNLSRDEQETHISFTAQDRIDGVVHVFTDDPVWLRKMESIEGFVDVSDELGLTPPSRAFRSTKGSISVSLRQNRKYTDEERETMRQRFVERKEQKGEENG